MNIQERQNQIYKSINSFKKDLYHKSEILPELLSYQQEVVNIAFSDTTKEKNTLRFWDAIEHYKKLSAEHKNIANSELEKFIIDCKKANNKIKAEISGNRGEEIVLRNLETLKIKNTISKNIELQNETTRSEIDTVVFTQKGAFIIEVKNTKKNIFIDRDGLFFRVTDERQQFDSNIAEKMQIKEALLRNELDKLGYSGLQIFKIVVFTNTKAEIQNKCKQLQTCFSNQLATIIENWNAPIYLRTNDLYIMSEALNKLSSSATFPMELDTEAAKKNFALLAAKLELAESSKAQMQTNWFKNLASILLIRNRRYATANAATAV